MLHQAMHSGEPRVEAIRVTPHDGASKSATDLVSLFGMSRKVASSPV